MANDIGFTIEADHPVWAESRAWLVGVVGSAIYDKVKAEAIVQEAIAKKVDASKAFSFDGVKLPNEEFIKEIIQKNIEADGLSKLYRNYVYGKLAQAYKSYAFFAAMRDCRDTTELVPDSFPGVAAARRRLANGDVLNKAIFFVVKSIDGMPINKEWKKDWNTKKLTEYLRTPDEYDFDHGFSVDDAGEWKKEVMELTADMYGNLASIADVFMEGIGDDAVLGDDAFERLRKVAKSVVQMRITQLTWVSILEAS